jgi:hypothetical protein
MLQEGEVMCNLASYLWFGRTTPYKVQAPAGRKFNGYQSGIFPNSLVFHKVYLHKIFSELLIIFFQIIVSLFKIVISDLIMV